MLRWGSTPDERTRVLPGDEVVPCAEQVTRAITIDAPPHALWPWLIQMGQDRAGFYSHDRLERLVGAGIRNAERIVPEWQHLEVGDLVRTNRRIERLEPLGWWVARLEPERLLLLRSDSGRWSWTLHLEPLEEGRTRLLSRERAQPRGRIGRALRRFPYEPVHFVMETGVLRGLKQRAEGPPAGPPRLTFASELEPEAFRELLADGTTLPALRRLGARVALSLPELDDDRAALVRWLNEAAVPVVAIPLVRLEQGRFLNLDNAPAAAERLDELLAWTLEHGLEWDAVSFDLEPSAEELRRVFVAGEGLAVLRQVLPRAFDEERLRRGTQAYARLVDRVRGTGLRVESFQFPFLVDDRRARSTLVHRVINVPDVRTDRDTLMLYTSFQGRLGAAVLASYGSDADAIAVGSTGGGESEGAEMGIPVLAWQELERDLRLARRFTDDISIHSLEGCVAEAMLPQLERFDWDLPTPLPVGVSGIDAARGLLRAALRIARDVKHARRACSPGPSARRRAALSCALHF